MSDESVIDRLPDLVFPGVNSVTVMIGLVTSKGVPIFEKWPKVSKKGQKIAKIISQSGVFPGVNSVMVMIGFATSEGMSTYF